MARTIELHVQAFREDDAGETRRVEPGSINALLPEGIEVAVVRAARAYTPSPGRRSVRESELRACLNEFIRTARPTDGDERWWAHVTLAQSMRMRTAFGVTYNANPSGRFVRRGFAVFLHDIDERDSSGLLFLRTLVHELGHVLNLDHADGGSRSLMTSSPPFPLEPQDLQFSPRCRHHLVEHPIDEVAPGRSPFGVVFDDPDPALRHPPREWGSMPDWMSD